MTITGGVSLRSGESRSMQNGLQHAIAGVATANISVRVQAR